jgi:hypothetical protein
MTSVPLGFWPDNLSSLAWVGICISLVGGSLLNEYNVFDWYWAIITTNIIITCLGIFVLDQLFLVSLSLLINTITGIW